MNNKQNEKLNSAWYQFQKEGKKFVDQIENKEQKIRIINKKYLLEKQKWNSETYFNWDWLFDSGLVEKFNIQIFGAISDRNKGKSTWTLNYMLKNWKLKKEKFLIIRGRETEVEGFITKSIASGWMKENKITCKSLRTGLLLDENNENCGYIVALSTMYKQKSIEFKNLGNILFDEFITDKNIKEVDYKLIDFLITAIRNSKTKIFFTANYGDTSHPIMSIFNYYGEQELEINWLMMSIWWTVPRNIFNTFQNKNSITYRLALSNFEIFKREYAGESLEFNKLNLLRNKNIDDLFYLFTWEFEDYKIVFDIDLETNIVIARNYISDIDQIKLKIITTDSFVKIYKNHNAVKVDATFFPKIIEKWINNNILCETAAIRSLLSNKLAQISNQLKLF